MWRRNALFLGVVFLALAGALKGLFPSPPRPAGAVVPAPPTGDESWREAAAFVDAAFHAEWRRQGVRPVATTDDLTYARRVSLALRGAIPSLEEVREFESIPPATRRSWWVEQLSRDERTAPYLAERFARALVGNDVGPFIVYRRRRFVSWLTEQLRRDRPYDEVVRELIASSGLGTDQPATNFLNVAINFDSKPAPDETVLAARTARAFLGIRLDCAQCHDHPYAPWKQRDFAQLAAYFTHSTHTLVGLQDRPGDPHRDDAMRMASATSATPQAPYHAELAPDWGSRRWQLAHWITHPDNRALARATVNRVWALVCGRPLVEPLDDLPQDPAELHPALITLANDFADNGYRLSRLLRVIVGSEAFSLQSKSGDNATEETTAEPSQESIAEDESDQAAEASWRAFPMTPLRPEQWAAALAQTASLIAIDGDSAVLLRVIRWFEKEEFVTRFGDAGAEELAARPPTVPQRLLVMNGKLAHEVTNPNPATASARIAQLAPDNATAIETAYLVCLTRRPSPLEQSHFVAKLQGKTGPPRERALADLCWTLVNSVEFSCNH